MQRPRGMRVPPFLHRTELSVFALWWDSWHEPLRPGKGDVGLGSLQTLLDLATSGVFQCASSSVSRNSALEGGSGRVGENHGFWVLQAVGKAQSDTVTAGGGWVFWVPREAAAQGHTAFGFWAATEGSPWRPSFPCCLPSSSVCQLGPRPGRSPPCRSTYR